MAASADRRGKGVRIAIIDSGVHSGHPHVGSVERAVAFDDAGLMHEDAVDRLGHGTVVAAAIHEKAPEASLLIIKVFDRQLAATGTALVAGMEWAIDAGAHVINLSLGSTNESHRDRFAVAVERARAAGCSIVAAAPTPEHYWLPGGLSGVIGVELDWTCPRDECTVIGDIGSTARVRASGYPRPIPGVSPEQNLKGLSIAVANVTGLLAASFHANVLR